MQIRKLKRMLHTLFLGGVGAFCSLEPEHYFLKPMLIWSIFYSVAFFSPLNLTVLFYFSLAFLLDGALNLAFTNTVLLLFILFMGALYRNFFFNLPFFAVWMLFALTITLTMVTEFYLNGFARLPIGFLTIASYPLVHQYLLRTRYV